MERERAKLAHDSIGISSSRNESRGISNSDAIVETTSSSLRVTKRKKKISDDRSDLVPIDLVMEILKRSPVKTLARFLCVSKLWKSIIRSRCFKKLYVAESSSSNRPGSLIFALRRDKDCGRDCFYYSSLQTQNPGEATYHVCHPTNMFTINSSSVHGLICYGPPSKVLVYNPSMRRSITLPEIDSQRIRLHHFLGYDPIDGDYKLLCMTTGKFGVARELQVLTLEKGDSWRMIENSPPSHSPDSPQICIDGVLYYGAYIDDRKDRGVISFDVRAEKFDLIKVPKGIGTKFTRMTRFNGKLALMYTGFRRIQLWVLEDAAKHEWCNESFPFPRLTAYRASFEAFCVIDETGEFVLAPRGFRQASPYYVVYYDPKKKSVRKVDIEGITEQGPRLWVRWKWRTMSIFPGQVENLMFL